MLNRLLWLCALACLVAAAPARDEDVMMMEYEENDIAEDDGMRANKNQTTAEKMNLPSNATSIRSNISDTFSCDNRTYGYYADVENECQLFHVCHPVNTTSGRQRTYKYSFICPDETVFDQEVMVCVRTADAINCTDSPDYYDRNEEMGKEDNATKYRQFGYRTPIVDKNNSPNDIKQTMAFSSNPLGMIASNMNFIEEISDVEAIGGADLEGERIIELAIKKLEPPTRRGRSMEAKKAVGGHRKKVNSRGTLKYNDTKKNFN